MASGEEYLTLESCWQLTRVKPERLMIAKAWKDPTNMRVTAGRSAARDLETRCCDTALLTMTAHDSSQTSAKLIL